MIWNKIVAITYLGSTVIMGAIVTRETIKESELLGYPVGLIMGLAIVAMYEFAKRIWRSK